MSEIPSSRSWTTATITAIDHVTPGMVSIQATSEIVPIRAGQHVDIRLTAPDGYQAQRSYSIASAPGDPFVELLIERIEIGEVSPYFTDVAQVGDTFEIKGPIGAHFVWDGDSTDPILLVAGGSGIAPLLAILRHRVNTGVSAPMLLLYSARTWDDVAMRDELFAAEAADPEITVILTITRGSSQRERDFARRIDSEMIGRVLNDWGQTPAVTYICGSNAFVESATAGLLSAGIEPGTIRTERYG